LKRACDCYVFCSWTDDDVDCDAGDDSDDHHTCVITIALGIGSWLCKDENIAAAQDIWKKWKHLAASEHVSHGTCAWTRWVSRCSVSVPELLLDESCNDEIPAAAQDIWKTCEESFMLLLSMTTFFLLWLCMWFLKRSILSWGSPWLTRIDQGDLCWPLFNLQVLGLLQFCS
jgi:hypothetical protein